MVGYRGKQASEGLSMIFSSRQFVRKVYFSLICKLRGFHSDIIFYWLIYSKSQPLICNQKSAMVFSPHQDDETLGCGGMIALKRKHRVPVKVVFLTNEQSFYIGNLQNKVDELIQVRKQEAIAALNILGVAPPEIHFFEQPDGTLQNLSSEQQQCVVEQLARLLQLHKPEEVYVPHRKDRHADHEETYKLVRTAIAQSRIQVELLQYPIWLFWQAPLFFSLKLQELTGAYRLSIHAVQDQKRQAFATYCSQHYLNRGFLRHFLGAYEIFFKAELK